MTAKGIYIIAKNLEAITIPKKKSKIVMPKNKLNSEQRFTRNLLIGFSQHYSLSLY